MSDSPASRPKRNSSFASFYIDEDDFEDDSVVTGESKKASKEEVFTISEKYASDSDSKSNAYESNASDSESDEFEPKPSPKKQAITVKKQPTTKKKTIIKTPVVKSKSLSPKVMTKNTSNAKGFEDNEFELVVSDENNSGSDQESDTRNSKSRVHDENIDKQMKKTGKEKGSVTAKKVKPTQQIIKTSIATVIPRPSPASNRPRFSTSVEKVKIPGQMSGPRRVGLSRSAPTRPLSPVKLKKFD